MREKVYILFEPSDVFILSPPFFFNLEKRVSKFKSDIVCSFHKEKDPHDYFSDISTQFAYYSHSMHSFSIIFLFHSYSVLYLFLDMLLNDVIHVDIFYFGFLYFIFALEIESSSISLIFFAMFSPSVDC